MIAIDTNALLILIIGSIDCKIFKTHRRTSIYGEIDYDILVGLIKDFKNLVVTPNIWTEVDNLLNDFNGSYKDLYISQMKKVTAIINEEYIESFKAFESDNVFELGLTDTQILSVSIKCKRLITADSKLSDYAKAYGVEVFDLVKERNQRLD